MRRLNASNTKNKTTGALRLLTNFPQFPPKFEWAEKTWESCFTSDFPLSRVRGADLLLVNGDLRLLAKLVCAGLFLRRCRKPIVAVDVVLRRPSNALKATMLRSVFDRIDQFIHYFRDLTEYERFYGISQNRSLYVPFKPKLRLRQPSSMCTGDYVLCFGQSMRDYDAFFSAMSGLPIPGAISEQTATLLRKNGSINVRTWPANIQVLQDDFSLDAQMRILEGARLVTLPVLPSNICASGIGTYLNSMALGKAVVISAGPGVSDILTHGEAVVVPPNDIQALREAIVLLWNDERLRSRVAERGRLYAESLGGEYELMCRIKEVTMHWYSARVE